MPRIDPLQLLKCLGVLLTPTGGIRSNEEVQRLASLMMKFSKKLVSKCVYILILKNTEPQLLGLFMSAGGWTLVLTWLSDGISGKNWALVSELLELLLMCPVDVERLKSNSIPRLVKGLSKDETLGQVNILASKLVEQWLKIVKDETVSPEVTSTVVIVNQDNIVVEEIPQDTVTPGLVDGITLKVDDEQIEGELSASSQVVVSPQQFYKLTVRDGKQVIAKVDSVVSDSAIERTEQSSDSMTLSEDNITVNHVEAHAEVTEEKEKKEVEKKSSKEKERDRDREKERDKSKHDRSSKHRSSSSSSKSNSKSSSSKDKHSNSSSSSRDKNKDKDRDRTKDRDKHKHRSNGSVKHSSSSSSSNSSSTNKDNKEKQAEKDKDTLAKIQPKSVDKLGRIPKKSSSSSSSSSDNKKSDKKSSDSSSSEHRTKPSISIEVRKKDSGDRPKTVKVFNSKLRSTGLEEAPKPPPPRTTPKKPTTLPNLPVKRPSPSREAPPPPEKRIKLPDTDIEKPGGIKLIPPKPKPAFLQESNMFMDALASSATNKKEPKKRKRRTSVSKDAPTTPTTTSPPSSPSVATPSPLNSPLALKNIAAPKFYKETLDTEETKPAEEEIVEQPKPKEPEESNNEIKSPDQVVEEEEGPTENVVKEVDGIRGVLVYHKRKGPKKSVKWRQESELEEIQYFELDETERVNVTKTFMDMKQMEHVGEREALQLSRKLPNEDLMDERIPWKALIPIDLPAALAESGKKSLEKDIQFAREKVILQALYFNRSMLPDSAAEPDPETHQMTDPVIIPLDDVTGNPDSINDFQGTPWPEPKGSPPHPGPMPSGPPNLFSALPPFSAPMAGPPGGGPGFSNIPPQNFNGPNFIHPPHLMGAGDWRPMGDGPMPPETNHSGPINPLFNQRPDNFNDNPPVGFPPQGFGPPGPMGPPGPGPGPGPMYPNFPNNRGVNRGGFRNMGRGGWFRPAGPPPGWHGNRGGGGGNHWGGRGGGGGGICKQFKMHGYCRQRDTCPFMHPQSNAHNGPY